MERRTLSGSVYTLTYDSENHLTAVSWPGVSASFVYDGDGNRVKGTIGGVTTIYIGNYFEWTGSTSTMVKYYYAGSTRIAMRTGTGSGTTGLLWLFGDHLGSTSAVANADGSAGPTQLYKPWGEKRPAGASSLPTTYRYTGQRQESSLGGTDGLYFYGARWLDPALGRFVQPDTLVPGMDNPQRWDRFGYVLNNPLRYTDPSGHREAGPCERGEICDPAQGEEQGNNSDTSTDEGGCGGQGCDLGGNNDDKDNDDTTDNDTLNLPKSGNPTIEENEGCPQGEIACAIAFVALVPVDALLFIANLEALSIPVVGPIVEVLVFIPTDLILIDLHVALFQYGSEAITKPCEDIRLSPLPFWSPK
jgi:RHS repeat-associated protein